MYEYTYDTETGGILILDTLKKTTKEPRPVYAEELDILGFDKYWNYEKQGEAPYLWAESSFYFYRGVLVARILGGSLSQNPKIVLKKDKKGTELLPIGTQLEKVDLARMVAKNSAQIDELEKFTTDKIREVYQRYKDQLDCFHVSFSGGKDSTVLLHIIRQIYPDVPAIFVDTGLGKLFLISISGKILSQIWIIPLKIAQCKALLIQYLSISATVIQEGIARIFHAFSNSWIYQKSSSLFTSEICLLSQNGANSFWESLLMGHMSHMKSGPAKGHLQASSKYILRFLFFCIIL